MTSSSALSITAHARIGRRRALFRPDSCKRLILLAAQSYLASTRRSAFLEVDVFATKMYYRVREFLHFRLSYLLTRLQGRGQEFHLGVLYKF